MSVILQATLCSPKHLLQIILQDLLLAQEDFLKKTFPCLDHTHILRLKSRFQTAKNLLKHVHKTTPLKTTQLIYLSAIPHQICVYANICAATVAKILTAHLSVKLSGSKSHHVCAQIPANLLNHINVHATPSGYLEFRMDDWAIAHWLTCLTQPVTALFVCLDPQTPTDHFHPAQHSYPSLFSIQHTHARCCSLLRLAAQQHIELSLLEDSSPWQGASPRSIAWLTMEKQLCTNHPSERQLINQCLSVLDELPYQTDRLHNPPQALHPAQIITLARDLAEAFSAMHRQCQVWGALQSEGRDRLTAHLALVLVTQRLLYGLLQIGLGAIAPHEL